MSSYAVLKFNKETQECKFLMKNAAGTRTFKNDIANAWTTPDHRKASDMLTKCVEKHKDKDKFTYLIDDLDESGDW